MTCFNNLKFRRLFARCARVPVSRHRRPIACLHRPAPTISKIISDAEDFRRGCRVERVHTRFDVEGGSTLKVLGPGPTLHNVASSDGNIVPPAVVQWAEATRAVYCSQHAPRHCSVLKVGISRSSGSEWKPSRPIRSSSCLLRFGFAACGWNRQMLAGDAIQPAVQHGADDTAANFVSRLTA